ncbi:StbA family protein [Caldanaerobacter subterraneus subsp. yonseiensis KB-1]|uniref:StbA family protein n=1 Tax=Caldanaerobacter subterraneus subsp. yonseiensis KB-1 TaxID=1388761 RepID=U5CWV4_CALSX|nr:ParM/StbA family protein [Caldanaerobacter subterraneus]ERM92517.1 StbA family protein [Caldanaerobacter subterraneus subsp. yonseiensis KB-1]
MFKIGLDVGYGYVKGVNEKGKEIIFPSLVGNAYERVLAGLFGVDNKKTDNMHVVIVNGKKEEYFVGELARREGKNVSYVFDEDKINHPNTRALITASCLLLFPEEEVPVHVVTGLPLEQYVHKKEEFKNMLKNFKVMAYFKGDERVKTIKFERITIFPQAAGAVYYAVLDDVQKYLIKGSYIGLIDIGFKTTDFIVFMVEDKLILREDMSGTMEVGMSALNNEVDKMFTQKTGSKIDLSELIRLISDGRIFYKGRELNFTREIDEVRNEIARVIKDKIKLIWGSKLDFFNTVFLAGGGARELLLYMKDIYENTLLVKNAQFANAKGFLKVAELEEKKNG